MVRRQNQTDKNTMKSPDTKDQPIADQRCSQLLLSSKYSIFYLISPLFDIQNTSFPVKKKTSLDLGYIKYYSVIFEEVIQL